MRWTFRIALGVVAVIAIAVIVVVLKSAGPSSPETWATIAGALAVVAAILSAWTAQRVVELEEDARKPSLRVAFDATSRYGLLLLRVTNTGGGTAHQISIHWDNPLTNAKGQSVSFLRGGDRPDLEVLAAGESIATIVDGYVQFFERYAEAGSAIFRGSVSFADSAGSSYRDGFVLDADQLRGTPYYDDEALKTHYQVQQLPDRLRDLTAEVKRLGSKIEPPPSSKPPAA